MKNIILLSGNAGSGKSTLAKILCNNFHYHEYALGDKVKELTLAIINNVISDNFVLTYQQMIDNKQQYRWMFQNIGTECCRKVFGDDFWCEILDKKIISDNYDNIVISDIRYQNEYQYFYKKYGTEYIKEHIYDDPIEDNKSDEAEVTFANDYTTGFLCIKLIPEKLYSSDIYKHSSEMEINSIPADITFSTRSVINIDNLEKIIKRMHL